MHLWHDVMTLSLKHLSCSSSTCLLLSFLVLFDKMSSVAVDKRSFEIDYEGDCFLKDGKPFRYISGCMHYFRVPRFYWSDRLKKMRAAGLTAVETYVAWQVHESVQGKYDFSHDNDIFEFIRLAQQNDLLVILRPGPFIDAERDFGGLPAWLLKKKDITLRTSKDEFYMNAVGTWFSYLLPKLKNLTYSNGGPIIMMQVENEYGSYHACDKVYLEFLRHLFLKHLGNDIILFTVDDGFREGEIECGSLPSLFKTVDFGPTKDVTHGFDQLRKAQPKGPLVNTEYYTGHYDQWGDPHNTRSTELVVDKLDLILQQNASVNMYMFEGGTSFGFMNGAVITKEGNFVPETTSYDFDAPLSEAGDPTEKYYAIRKLISKYQELPKVPVPGPVPKAAYGIFPITKMLSLFDALKYLAPSGPIKSKYPKTMEEIDQPYGFVLYRASVAELLQSVSTESGKAMLKIDSLHDRTVVMVDEHYQATINRSDNVALEIDVGKQIDILVENQGRINYKYDSFKSLRDPKGILGNVSLNGKLLEDWDIYPLPLDNMHEIPQHDLQYSSAVKTNVPSFYFGQFSIEEAKDTFLSTDDWGKGQAFINNFNLGRYWTSMGPQETLYVPRCFLNAEPKENTVVLFELDGLALSENATPRVSFLDKPVWKKMK